MIIELNIIIQRTHFLKVNVHFQFFDVMFCITFIIFFSLKIFQSSILGFTVVARFSINTNKTSFRIQMLTFCVFSNVIMSSYTRSEQPLPFKIFLFSDLDSTLDWTRESFGTATFLLPSRTSLSLIEEIIHGPPNNV